MLFSVTLCIAGNLLFSVNELLGPGVLFHFAAGRYYHPRREERVLLLIDLRSSTRSRSGSGEERFLTSSIASSLICRSRSRRRAAKSINMWATR